MIDPRETVPPEYRHLLRRAPLPETVDPMLATLTDERFDDPDWIYERKLDGERILARRTGGHAALMTRRGHDVSTSYPDVVDAFDAQGDDDYEVDGEMVAFDGDRMSFERLAARMQLRLAAHARSIGIDVFHYLFDITWLNGWDLTALPLTERKKLLRAAVDFSASPRLRLVTHRSKRGVAYYHEACLKGWEGLVAKDATKPYAHGRSRSWLKFKCVAQQELVVGGFTDPRRSRVAFGALLVGYYEDGELRYAGKVGTGFNDATLRELHRKLRAIERKTSPFAGESPDPDAHWVTPRLVAQVGFAEWTSDGHLRHPRFLGLRRDKQARDVVREQT